MFIKVCVLQGSFLVNFKGPYLVLCFSFYINDLPDDVICNIAICFDDTTVYSNCDLASNLMQQLQLASDLESDLGDKMDWVLLQTGSWSFQNNLFKSYLFCIAFPPNHRLFF